MLGRFTLHEPETIRDVLGLLLEYGESAAVLAGGTELLLAMKQGVLRYDHLINLKGVPGLNTIDADSEGFLTIGALVTHRAVEKSELVHQRVPLLVGVERRIANVRIRNMGTLGGNLCWSDPQSDIATVLLALNAHLKLAGLEGERLIRLGDFFLDYYETALRDGELLTEIQVPVESTGTKGSYLRFVRGERASVSVAVIFTLTADGGAVADAVIALGCVNPFPIRIREAEEIFIGKAVAEVLPNAERAGHIASQKADPADDAHASVWYKRQMVKVLVERAISEIYHGEMAG